MTFFFSTLVRRPAARYAHARRDTFFPYLVVENEKDQDGVAFFAFWSLP